MTNEMTKEQAIDIIKCLAWHGRPEEEKIEQAIKTLEQPTSDDCVSRQATLDAIIKELGIRNESYLLECERPIYNVVKDMPPVTPTFPKGATNGDVIKAMFPNIEADEIKTNTGGYIEVKYLDTTDKRDATAFRKSWWNAPYRKVEE